jgi:hypothetical protein
MVYNKYLSPDKESNKHAVRWQSGSAPTVGFYGGDQRDSSGNGLWQLGGMATTSMAIPNTTTPSELRSLFRERRPAPSINQQR